MSHRNQDVARTACATNSSPNERYCSLPTDCISIQTGDVRTETQCLWLYLTIWIPDLFLKNWSNICLLINRLWCKVRIHDNMIEMKSWDGAVTLETELDLFKWKQYESEIIWFWCNYQNRSKIVAILLFDYAVKPNILLINSTTERTDECDYIRPALSLSYAWLRFRKLFSLQYWKTWIPSFHVYLLTWLKD